MCPICVSTAVLIAGSVTSMGGVAAVIFRKFGVKHAVDQPPKANGSKEDHHG